MSEAEAALVTSYPDEFFDHAGRLVRPVIDTDIGFRKQTVEALRLVELTPDYLADRLTCSAAFQRFDLKRKAWLAVDCPERTARTLLHREGLWRRIPRLRGIARAPFLRHDGSTVEVPGYDPETGILLKASASFPPLPVTPSKADAAAALNYLDHTLLTGFPFVEPLHRAVALAGLLTALDRRGMAMAPLFGVSAPTPGTGKSLLVDLDIDPGKRLSRRRDRPGQGRGIRKAPRRQAAGRCPPDRDRQHRSAPQGLGSLPDPDIGTAQHPDFWHAADD